MRFTSPSARPSLTPMGYRLLHLSEQKLSNLDGISYDEGKALWKGVLVREAVRSAWRSVEEGSVVEMNDWSARGAMGLDVVSEDEEEEVEDLAESKEQQWFEDLMSTIGEEEQNHLEEAEAEHEWVESNVTMPDFDDFDYDTNTMVAYTLPLPVSPTTPPTVPAVPSAPITIDSLPTVGNVTTDVDIVEVSEDEDDEDIVEERLTALRASVLSMSTVERASVYSTEEASVPHDRSRHHRHRHHGLIPIPSPGLIPVSPMSLDSRLTPPYADRPTPADYYADLDICDDIDELALPPPLIRSLSSSSTSSADDDECGTPPLRCSELEVEGGAEVWTEDMTKWGEEEMRSVDFVATYRSDSWLFE